MKQVITVLAAILCTLSTATLQEYHIDQTLLSPGENSIPLFSDWSRGELHGWVSSTTFSPSVRERPQSTLKWDPGSLLVFSRGQHFFGIFSLDEREGTRYNPRGFTFSVYRSDGYRRYVIDGNIPDSEMNPVFFVSDADGSAFQMETSGGVVIFYDSKGNRRNERVLFSDEDFNVEKSVQAMYSGNGSYIAVMAMRSSVDEDETAPAVFLFSSLGRLIWQLPLGTLYAGSLGISDNGHYILAYGYSFDPYSSKFDHKCMLINRYGKEISRYDFNFRFTGFSPDSRWLYACDRENIRIITPANGEIMVERRLTDNHHILRDVVVNSSGTALIIAGVSSLEDGRYIFRSPVLYLVSNTGKIIWQKALGQEEWFDNTSIFLSDDEHKFGVLLHDRYLIYSRQ